MAEQKYTTRVLDAINNGISVTQATHLASLDVPVLLRVLFDQDGSMYVNILKKLDIDVKQVSQLIDSYINNAVKTTSTEDPDSSSDVKNILYNATKYETEMHDEYMSVEHLLLVQFDCKHTLIDKLSLLEHYNKKDFRKTIYSIRGGNHATSDNPDTQH